MRWLTSLDTKSTLVGAVTLAFVLGIGKYVLVPGLRVLSKLILQWFYPLLSGAVVLDRVWSLPRYRKAIEHRVSEIINPWLNEGQKLSDILVPVSVGFAEGGADRLELGALFLKFARIVIIGDPGSGKTTGLKAIALRCLRGELLGVSRQKLLPVFISLRRYSESKKPIEEFFLDEFAALDFPNASRCFRRLRKQGRVVFLLDGLDEVEEAERSPVLQQVQALIRQLNSDAQRCHVLLTSRPVGYDHQLQGVVDRTVRMADFTPADIRRFIDNWEFQAPKSQAGLFDAIVTRQAILGLCKNPLMLTIVAYLYGNTQYELPHSRDEFYRVCLEALLRNWDAARNIDSRNKIAAFKKSAFLERFAFKALNEGVSEFREVQIIEQIEEFIRERKYSEVCPERFLLELRRSGLLASLPTGEIFFAHKTLAESLAATHLRNKTDELSRLWKKKPYDWLEVCSLYVSDPSTDLCDIGTLIDDARSIENWNGALILAGEAHSCPDAQRQWIIQDLLPNQKLWSTYEQRAVSALADLGDEARKVLTTMLQSDNVGVRIRALRTLGLVRKEWATRLIVTALADKSAGTVASETLALMGPDAVAIVKDLLSSSNHDVLIAHACLRVLKEVGGAETIRPTILLLSHDDIEVAQQAALFLSEMLSDRRLRQEFETMDHDNLTLPPKDEVRSIANWAVPWVDPARTTLRAIYSQAISNLQDRLECIDSPDMQVNKLAARLLIPALIGAGPELSGKWLPLVWKKPTLLKLEMLCKTLYLRGGRRDLREIWGRVQEQEREDVALTGVLLGLFYLFAMALYIVPTGFAIASARLPVWWASPVAVQIFIAAVVYVFVPSAREDFFTLFVALSVLPIQILWEIIVRGPRDVSASVSVSCAIAAPLATICVAISSAFILGGYWLIFLFAPLLSLLFTYERGNPPKVILQRRRNPLQKLLSDAEKIESGRAAGPDAAPGKTI